MEHFISVEQLTKTQLLTILKQAKAYKSSYPQNLEQIFCANLFYEPSTRTKMSFIVAERKLGIEVLDFNESISSTKKGESLYDTAKTFEAIGADLLVIRHPSDDWIEELQDISIPIINAGAGKKEHPTQCLLDLLTIYEEFGTFENLKITISGDIKHSRVAHSNVNALRKLGAEVYLSAPEGLEDPLLDVTYISMNQAVDISDVVMMLRVQHERHSQVQKNAHYLDMYGLTKLREKRMKNHAIILHPAPVNRGVEIDSELIECDRSRIFKQMENGVYVRMAIIIKLLKEWGMTTNENIIEKYNKTIHFEKARNM